MKIVQCLMKLWFSYLLVAYFWIIRSNSFRAFSSASLLRYVKLSSCMANCHSLSSSRWLQEAGGESEWMAVQKPGSPDTILRNDHVDVSRCKAARRRWTDGADAEHRGKRQYVLFERIQVGYIKPASMKYTVYSHLKWAHSFCRNANRNAGAVLRGPEGAAAPQWKMWSPSGPPFWPSLPRLSLK